uniref:Uncharacterized protein n=1 Tax=Anguilla anguilla TaxID=7936 RepID=A0A0E9QPV0_ANGAN
MNIPGTVADRAALYLQTANHWTESFITDRQVTQQQVFPTCN